MSHNFQANDRVKVTNHNSPFVGLVGIVSSVYHNTVFIKFEGSHGQPSGFLSECLELAPLPKLHDRVRITKSGKWTAQEGQVLSVIGNEVRVDLDYDVIVFETKDVEVIESFGPKRVEGQPIRFEDVQIGDTIETATDTIDNGVATTTIRKGTVGQIDPGHKILKTRGGSYLHGFDKEGGYRIKLISGVESDDVLMRLKNLPRESIISYRKGCKNELVVAVKLGEDAWNVMSSATNKATKLLTLREQIRNSGDTYRLVEHGDRNS